MPTSTFTRFHGLAEEIAKGNHAFGTHTYKAYLSNAAPNAATHLVKADIAEIAAGNGYPAGGVAATCSVVRTGNVAEVRISADGQITATGPVGPFRYLIFWNATNNNLVGYADYGVAISLGNGEVFNINYDYLGANNKLLDITV